LLNIVIKAHLVVPQVINTDIFTSVNGIVFETDGFLRNLKRKHFHILPLALFTFHN